MPTAIYLKASINTKDGANFETGKFRSKTYTIVPVVALVEGVVNGAKSNGPDLITNEQLSKAPKGWNGRPVTIGHPKVKSEYVLANHPKVLEAFQIGMLFNTSVEEGKLLSEAWIDEEMVEAVGGQATEMYEALKAGETIEVSTGFLADEVKKKGKFKGRTYENVLANYVPDHLAFLPLGTVGACSIEDGCGAARVNELQVMEYVTAAAGCGCGSTAEGGCKCVDPHVHETADEDEHEHEPKGVLEALRNVLAANAAPDDMISGDVQKLVQQSLSEANTTREAYVLGVTKDKVIYSSYSDSPYYAYYTFQRSYSIDSEGKVVLGDDAERVNLLTKIVPVKGDAKTKTMSVNEDPDMSDAKKEGAEGSSTQTDPATTDTKLATQEQKPVKFSTMEEFYNAVPEEMRESLKQGQRLLAERKSTLIEGLKATNRCAFNEEQLKSFDVGMLENLAQLANVPRYDGIATPKVQEKEDKVSDFFMEAPSTDDFWGDNGKPAGLRN